MDSQLNSSKSLHRTLSRRFDKRLKEKDLKINLDSNGNLLSSIPIELNELMIRLVDLAIARSERGGELSITIVQNKNAWEAEIADHTQWDAKYESSSDAAHSGNHCSSPDELESIQRILSNLGGELNTLRCPQGGLANHVIFPVRLVAHDSQNSEK